MIGHNLCKFTVQKLHCMQSTSKERNFVNILVLRPFQLYFDILTTGKSDLQCKIKETLLISELKPSLNENVGSEKLFLY